MKRIQTILLITFLVNNIICIPVVEGQDKLKGKISLSGAWALYPMAVTWAAEFKKLHPQVQIDISAGGAGKGMTDVISGLVDIAWYPAMCIPKKSGKAPILLLS
jgi:phosphate transport system substrate-binding protein